MYCRLTAALVLCLATSAAFAGTAFEPSEERTKVRTLSVTDRIRVQETIERLSYRHQIGATKPFEEAVPRTVIETKVRRYLEQSAALEMYWKTPITDDSLQRELERMTRGTRMPERLREIFAALGNDAFLIKECVARATLAERLTQNFYALDPRYHASSRAAIDALREQIASGALSIDAEHRSRTVRTIVVGTDEEIAGKPSNERRVSQTEFDNQRKQRAGAGQASSVAESRDAFSFDVVLSDSPTSARVATYSVPKVSWTTWWSTARKPLRAESVVAVALNRGALPTPAKGAPFDPNVPCTGDGWNNGILDGLPQARWNHTAVWTGSVMVIWSGMNLTFDHPNTGGRYDPVTDTWQTMTTESAPQGRVGNSAVWTGSEMIVWGGHDWQLIKRHVTGGRYDPIADRWTGMALGPSERVGHTAVWTGSRMIVWGGAVVSSPAQYPRTGALYDPSTDSWIPTATTGAPGGRAGHTAIWTGSRMVVLGGSAGVFPASSGGRYDPSTNSWSPVSDAPEDRAGHSAVWTGSSIVVWGGDQFVLCDHPYPPDCQHGYKWVSVNTGARYDPVLDRWIGMSVAGAPPQLSSPLVTWTGHDMIVLQNDGDASGGWRYDPSTDHWNGISPDGSLVPARGASLVWTGNLAITWGGIARGPNFNGVTLNTGRRYDPWTDGWTPTSAGNAPSRRTGHVAVWTGNEMIVWGGALMFPESGSPAGGDRYDPTSDRWTRIATESAPQSGAGQVALWSGTEMLVWGGGFANSGGRYDPRTDSWRAVSELNSPAPRVDSAAAWSGRQMVVWGGADNNSQPLQSGGIYDPATDQWTATSTLGAPSPRQRHSAVWTGSRVVFWGGYSGNPSSGSTNTGALYDPATDMWTATSITEAPAARPFHAAVWAGDRMIVWGGGASGGQSVNTGGRYDPATDTWSSTTTVGAPPPKTQHSAVAAGNLMLIWGGARNGYPNTGGSYDVANDRWTKITNPGDIEPTIVSAVWTGEAMIAWSGVTGGRYYLGDSLDEDCDQDGFSFAAGDCDDHDATGYPGAPELCDGLANDCGNIIWPFPQSSTEYDGDSDGWLTCAGDCNDYNVYAHPGQDEVCDGFDTDCDGNGSGETDADHDGYRVCQGDCNDDNWYARPGDHEECDGYDNDCDGSIDEGGDALCVFNDGCLRATCRGYCDDLVEVEGACDDGNTCTMDDRCIYGECGGTPVADTVCDDGNACTTDDRCGNGYCNGTDLNGTPCDDGYYCTTGDHCEYGHCRPGPLQECASDGNDCNGREVCDFDVDACVTLDVLSGCDDGNICTFDSCDPTTGCHHAFNVAPCEDGNACTVGDTCSDGLCLQGVPINCDDGNPCTDDACIPSTGCVYTNNDASCDDGSACTGWSTCEDGSCVGHDAVICAAGDQCHDAGGCDPATGLCSGAAKPDGTACDDSNLCTGGDTCQSGTCNPGQNGLNHPNPKSAGYYRKLCERRAHNQLPYQGDQLTDDDAECVGNLTSTFAGISTIDDICDVIYRDDNDGSNGHDTGHDSDAKDCEQGEEELIATALNICRGRVCQAQRLDSHCRDNAHSTVAASFADADAILSDAARDRNTCKAARCELREINNGHALEMNSLMLALERHGVRLSWSSAVLDDGSGAPSGYEVWRRPFGANDAFVKLGATSGFTFVDVTAGTAAWEYEITAVIPGG